MEAKDKEDTTWQGTNCDKASILNNLQLADNLEEMSDPQSAWLYACMHEAARRLRIEWNEWRELVGIVGPETQMDARIKQFVADLIERYLSQERLIKDMEYHKSIDDANSDSYRRRMETAETHLEKAYKAIAERDKEIAELTAKLKTAVFPEEGQTQKSIADRRKKMGWRWAFWHKENGEPK